MYVFFVGLILTFIGLGANIRGNASKFNTPSGGGSRIPPLAQVRLNESIQKVSGVKETTDKYFLKSNIIKPNKIGLIILFIGIALMVISYIHPL